MRNRGAKYAGLCDGSVSFVLCLRSKENMGVVAEERRVSEPYMFSPALGPEPEASLSRLGNTVGSTGHYVVHLPITLSRTLAACQAETALRSGCSRM